MDGNNAIESTRSEVSIFSTLLLIVFFLVIAILIASSRWTQNNKSLFPDNHVSNKPLAVPFILIRGKHDISPSRIIQKSFEKYKSDIYQALKGLSQQMDQAMELEHGLDIEEAAKLSTKIRMRIQKLSVIFDQNEDTVSSLFNSIDFTTALPDNRILENGTSEKEGTVGYSANEPNNPNPSTIFHPKSSTKPRNENAYDMTAQIVAHLVRDWSSAGAKIRQNLYGWVCHELVHRSNRQGPVLVPGAGMGRLAYDIYSQGFNVEANEISPVMAAAAKSILTMSTTGVIHPFALDAMTNEVDSMRRYDEISFPDISVVTSKKASLSFTIGDFVGAYYSRQVSTYDAIATCFFIDTATNIYEYLALIKRLLRRNGLWVNVGPIQWHANALLRPSVDELKDLIVAFGFKIVVWSVDEELVPYRQDAGASGGNGSPSFVRSTSYDAYRPLRFVAACKK